MFHKRLEIGKERMSTASFKKFRAWICSNLVEKRSERPVVVTVAGAAGIDGRFCDCHLQKAPKSEMPPPPNAKSPSFFLRRRASDS